MNGVSVCITAYRTKDYIKECLDSVARQSWFKNHDNWEIIVGVDCCHETLDYLKTIMGDYRNLRVLMMDSNRGTYVTSNTIMSQARYDTLFRFDSDDIMKENLVSTVLEHKGDNSMVMYYYRNFGGLSNVGWAVGTICIDKSVFMKYGGYRGWLCTADSDIYTRLSKVERVIKISDVLMYRRVHTDSLTRSPETGLKSKLRDYYRSLIKDMKIETWKDAVIDMETNTFKEIKNKHFWFGFRRRRNG